MTQTLAGSQSRSLSTGGTCVRPGAPVNNLAAAFRAPCSFSATLEGSPTQGACPIVGSFQPYSSEARFGPV